jgi:DNA-binding transcriptional LysR family regulator
MEHNMDRVIAAQVYNRICELGSLSAASRSLGISRPMVSRYLEQMEKWAGTRLVNRSTRKLTLTAAGEKVLLKTRSLANFPGNRRSVRQRFTVGHATGRLRAFYRNAYDCPCVA